MTEELTGADFSGAVRPKFGLTDFVLADCNLANVDGTAAAATRIHATGCRMTGINLAEARMRDVTIRGCRADLASFAAADLARVTFEDCKLTDATFLDAKLDEVRFVDCDLTHADFRGARMRNCEFRGSTLADIEGIEHLRGAAIDWPTIVGLADVWAAALGIDVLGES